MSTTIYIVTLCFFFGAILVVVGMRYLSATQQARARLANDEAYRRIAETSADAQTGTASALSSIQASLADVRTRLAAVEKILKDVQ